MTLNIIHNIDCLAGLKTLPENSINCCVSSPPYFGLRDYGNAEQIGLEETPEAFIDKLVAVFAQVYRVLKADGTLWINIGDSYASVGGGYNNEGSRGKASVISPKTQRAVLKGRNRNSYEGLKAKDLIGIPWMLAFALRKQGWYLRQDIIWAKPNPMPESVTDRCTKSHEYIFLLSKSQRYYYDYEAVKEPSIKGAAGSEFHTGKTGEHQLGRASTKPRSRADSFKREGSKREQTIPGQVYGTHQPGREESEYDLETRNKRSVWNVSTQPFSGAVESYHWQRVPLDAVSGGMKRITSLGCPVHGLLGHAGSSLFCDAHEAGESIHKLYTGDCLAPTRTLGSLSIAQKYASSFGLHNWDSDRQLYVLSAIRRNNEGRKTDLDLGTNQPCTSFAQTRAHIERTLEVHETSGLAGHMLLSSTLPDVMDDLLWGRIRTHSANSSSLSDGCSCAIYKKITKKTDHFATFPEELIVPCIKAGCPPGGLVLDPFMGAGTTAVVARKLNRNYIGFELNADYIRIAERRLTNQLGPLDPFFV